jgi:hypothetical protein
MTFPCWSNARTCQAYVRQGVSRCICVCRSEALAIAREVEHAYALGLAQRTLGRIAHSAGAPAETVRLLDEALETFTVSHARFEVARTRLDLARVAGVRGDRAAAAAHLAQARALFSELRVPRYLEVTERLMKQASDR